MYSGDKKSQQRKNQYAENKQSRYASYDSRNISIKTLRKNLDSLNEADRKLKIRVTDEKIILEKLLVELLRSEQ